MTAEIMSIRTKSNLESRLISESISPTLDLGDFEFIWALVSTPVYNTKPRIKPVDASTVFAQRAFSSPNGSL